MNAAKRSAMGAAWRLAGIALTLATVGGAACAQSKTKDESYPPRTWSVKLGGFLSNNGGMKAQASDLWWAGGIDYFPNLQYRPLKGDIHLGLNAKWRSTAVSDFHIIDLGARIIWPIYNPESAEGMRIWGGLGIGIYFIDTAFLGNTTQFGGKFSLGVDITKRWFLEVDYDYVAGFTDNQGNSLRADGLTFTGGYRF